MSYSSAGFRFWGTGSAAGSGVKSATNLIAPAIYLILLSALCAVAWLKPTDHADRTFYEQAIKASQGDIHLYLPERVPLYSVKVLYVLVSKYIGTKATTVAFYFALGWLVWLWTERKTLASALLIGSYISLDTARMATPDTMQAFLLLLGTWLFYKKKQFLGAIPLLLAIWVRTDALVLVGLILLLAFWQQKAALSEVLAIAILAGASWAVIDQYGYSYLRLLQTLKTPYFKAILTESLRSNLTMLFPYLLLAIPAWRNPLVRIAILGYLAHFLLFPNAESRYALPYMLILASESVVCLYRMVRDRAGEGQEASSALIP